MTVWANRLKVEVALTPGNLLTVDQASIEMNLLVSRSFDTSDSAHSKLEYSTAFAADGASSLRQTIQTGYSGAAPFTTSPVLTRVKAGTAYYAMGKCRAAQATSYTGKVDIVWLNYLNVIISTSAGTVTNLSNGSWVTCPCSATAPTGAVNAYLSPSVTYAPTVNDDIFDWDCFMIGESANVGTTWYLPGNGPWTDISAYWVGSSPVSLTHGRSDVESEIQPGRMSGLRLDNTDKRFTLGETSSPYYPNQLRTGNRVKISIYSDTTTKWYPRWWGYVDSLPVSWDDNGTTSWVTLSATDAMGEMTKSRWTARRVFTQRLKEGWLARRFWPLDITVSGSGSNPIDPTSSSSSAGSPLVDLLDNVLMVDGGSGGTTGTEKPPVMGAETFRKFANANTSTLQGQMSDATDKRWFASAIVKVDSGQTSGAPFIIHRGTPAYPYPCVGFFVNSSGAYEGRYYNPSAVLTNTITLTGFPAPTNWCHLALSGEYAVLNFAIYNLDLGVNPSNATLTGGNSNISLSAAAALTDNTNIRYARIGGAACSAGYVIVGPSTWEKYPETWYSNTDLFGLRAQPTQTFVSQMSNPNFYSNEFPMPLQVKWVGSTVGRDVLNLYLRPFVESPYEALKAVPKLDGGLIFPELDPAAGSLRYQRVRTTGVKASLPAEQVQYSELAVDATRMSNRILASSAGFNGKVTSISESHDLSVEKYGALTREMEVGGTETAPGYEGYGNWLKNVTQLRRVATRWLTASEAPRIPTLAVDLLTTTTAIQDAFLADVRVMTLIGLTGMPDGKDWPLAVEGWSEQISMDSWNISLNVTYSGGVLGDATFAPHAGGTNARLG